MSKAEQTVHEADEKTGVRSVLRLAYCSGSHGARQIWMMPVGPVVACFGLCPSRRPSNPCIPVLTSLNACRTRQYVQLQSSNIRPRSHIAHGIADFQTDELVIRG